MHIEIIDCFDYREQEYESLNSCCPNLVSFHCCIIWFNFGALYVVVVENEAVKHTYGFAVKGWYFSYTDSEVSYSSFTLYPMWCISSARTRHFYYLIISHLRPIAIFVVCGTSWTLPETASYSHFFYANYKESDGVALKAYYSVLCIITYSFLYFLAPNQNFSAYVRRPQAKWNVSEKCGLPVHDL
jgi:hypothetical protein